MTDLARENQKLLGQISDLELLIIDLYDADKVALLAEREILRLRIKDLEFVVHQARCLTQCIKRHRTQSDLNFAGFDSPILGLEQEELDMIGAFDYMYRKYVNPITFKEER